VSVEPKSLLDKTVLFCLKNKLIVFIFVLLITIWGIAVAPFNWDINILPKNPDSRLFGPVAVDAIPDIGENQQIVFTKWPGRSPQDVEDQISYPLTVALLGVPGVKSVRTYSMFGFSSIYVIFKENIDFYWSRSRVLEKLNSLSSEALPAEVKPVLGPDATALGQVYWYTLEGHDASGAPTGGWDLDELRSIQDWQVRYDLLGTDGISEVASIGGHTLEYQIDVDPDSMRAYNVSLDQVFNSIKMSNVDVGARTIEINKVEYVIRGLGFIDSLSDIENIVVAVNDNVPIYVSNVAHVSRGPALRRGTLDKGGAEAVGGVAVVRYGENPLRAIQNLKKRINLLAPSLPEKIVIDYTKITKQNVESFSEELGFKAYAGARLNQEQWLKWAKQTDKKDHPEWLTVSKVTIVPFYDRSGLINETLGTLHNALTEEIMVTVIVILVMLMHLRSSIVISLTLPLAVLITFIAMKIFNVEANIVALSGIAIAIGTIVDMGVIICENIIRHLERAIPEDNRLTVVYNASSEVAGAVLTAILTTVVSFLPVFTMIGAEGKLFRPLAFTKTFALIASVLVAIMIIPAVAHTLFTFKSPVKRINESVKKRFFQLVNIVVIATVCVWLTQHWMPLGPSAGFIKNIIVVALPIGALLTFFKLFVIAYPRILAWCLNHKALFLSLPVVIIIFGCSIWLGFSSVFSWIPQPVKETSLYVKLSHAIPGLGKEFMPNLDEGSFLYMPTTMPHASIGEAMDVLRKQDIAFYAIPEIESAVGKIGRADTPLDPAPVSMIETIINYKPEYVLDESGKRLLYAFDESKNDLFRDLKGNPIPAVDGDHYTVHGTFIRDENGGLVPDKNGTPFRIWRPTLDTGLNPGRAHWSGIKSANDIWDKIIKAGQVPGTTSAPKLQPIAARIVMLQSGMRAPMGIKVMGPDLKTIEHFGLQLEKHLKQVPGVHVPAVFADRIVGKPYLEIDINRTAIARYGLHIRTVQNVIEVAVGGQRITTTVEGRERYPVRVRYMRELRDTIESLENILITSSTGQHIPLKYVAEIKYTRGPQMIKSEDARLIGYVLFDKESGYAEVDVVENAQEYLRQKELSGELIRPNGLTYKFAGNYQNQVRAQKTLSIVLPLALFTIFIILYFQFKSIPTTSIVFSSIAVAWAGGFILIWLYGQTWFMNIELLGVNMRELFQMHNINLSVAVWVGFLALFGIASDDGVVITTYLDQTFREEKITTVAQIRELTIKGASRRIRPCMMTSATTILALLPILTSTGRGSDIMIPMAIPSFGGMLLVLISSFVIPVLYSIINELKLRSHT